MYEELFIGGVISVIWSVQGICFDREQSQICIILFLSENTYFPLYVRNMFWVTVKYKYHGCYKKKYTILEQSAKCLETLALNQHPSGLESSRKNIQGLQQKKLPSYLYYYR